MLPRLKFRDRIGLLVVLAVVALAVVTSVTLVLGRRAERHLIGIETQYVPLMELDADLKRTFADLVRRLEDAANAGEEATLAEADRLSAALVARLQRDRTVLLGNGADPDALIAAFRSYYDVARTVSAALAKGAPFADIADKIEQMRKAQADLVPMLDQAATPDRAKLTAAFAAARASNRDSLRLDIIVAISACVLMTLISWRIVRRMVGSLQAVAAGVERIAHGELTEPIDVPPGDEIGDLAHQANRTAQRLAEYREESDREAWIKTGVAELGEAIAGELPLDTLAQKALDHTVRYLQLHSAAMYYCEDDAPPRLVCAHEGAFPATFDDAVPDAVHVDGTRTTVPLSHEGRVLGVLVAVTAAPPEERVIDLLGRIRTRLGIAFRVAESRHRMQALLRETQRQARAAETANKELEAFSYSVSHDLRGPLRGIDGFSQAIVEDEGDRLSPTGRDQLRRIRAGAQRMGELIDDLLKLSRMSRGAFHKDRVDISALATAVVADLQRATPDRVVEVEIAPDVIAYADARLMRIVLENLLGNAWKFTAKTESARVVLGTTERDGELVYFIKDNGAGFDMRYVDKLFGAFQRLHTDKEFSGTGIGLATVQRVIVRHGGTIWAEGTPGAGATFSFTLPRDAKPT